MPRGPALPLRQPSISDPHDSLSAADEAAAFPLAWALVPALLLAGLVLLVHLSGSNTPLFITLNAAGGSLPSALWATITLGGSVLGALALLAPTLKTRPRWLASAFLASPLAMLFSQGGKQYFDIMRPAGVLEAESFNLIGQKLYVHAFPSGHATTVFVLAAALILAWPRAATRWRAAVGILGLAGLVAFSRIAVGAHWPLDVLAGAAGGWTAGAIGVWLSIRLPAFSEPRGVRVMATIVLATSLALLFVDIGQPEAHLYRIGLAAWGIGGAAAALMNDPERS